MFVGDYSAQASGDYVTGSNHVLPTAGAAAARGGLSAADFVRVSTVQRLTRQGFARIAADGIALAEADDAYKKGVREIEERFNQMAEALAAEHQRKVEEARAVAEREMSAVHKRDRDARQRVRNEMEPTERDIKSKFDHAVWMAESVFEAADQTIRLEAKKAKEVYDAQKEAKAA